MRKNIFIRIVSLACILALLLSTTVPSVFASGASYFPAYSGSSGSLVEGLNTIGVESSFAFRKEIAEANNIVGYRGTAEQNTALLQKLQEGRLIDPNADSTSNSSSIPVSAVTKASDFITLEVSVDTTVREKASQNAKILSRVEQGGYLISTGSVTNFWGNVWFRVIDIASGDEGYIYSGKVCEHQCSYQKVDGSNCLIFCKCGNVKNRSSGMLHTNAFALPQSVINPEVVVALGGMGAAAGAAATAALPYIAVGAAFGTVIYILVSVADNSVTVEKVSTDWRRLDDKFRPDEGLYYNGMMKNDFFFIDVANPMDVNDAIDTVESSIISNRLFSTSRKQIYWFIYTLTDFSALCLVEDFVSTHYGYTSNYVDEAHTKGNMMKQFRHYHIVKTFDPRGSHLGGHILFGAPQLGAFNEGMWA